MMTQPKNGDRSSRGGYSLVEVTLALLVVAIGLTATFALFPEGLRATRAAVDDTEVAMFAEYVFSTLELTAGKNGGNYGPDWSINDTDDFISLMLSHTAQTDKFELRDGGGVEVFYWIPDYYGLQAGDYYFMNFQDFWTSAFTYTLQVGLKASGGFPTYAVLRVWPGEYLGAGLPAGDPRIFYREILPIR